MPRRRTEDSCGKPLLVVTANSERSKVAEGKGQMTDRGMRGAQRLESGKTSDLKEVRMIRSHAVSKSLGSCFSAAATPL